MPGSGFRWIYSILRLTGIDSSLIITSKEKRNAMKPRINTDKHGRKTTHTITNNMSLPPSRSVKTRRNPLVYNRLYLQMAFLERCQNQASFEQKSSRTGGKISPALCISPSKSANARNQLTAAAVAGLTKQTRKGQLQ